MATDHNSLLPAPTRHSWKRWRGTLVLILCIALLELLAITPLKIPNPPALLVMILVYSAFVGGMTPGFVSAAIAWAYIAYYFSTPGHFAHYNQENLERVLVWCVSIPGIAWMVGRLKDLDQNLIRAALQSGTAQLNAVLQAMGDGVGIFDMKGEMVYLNDALARINGFAGVDEMRRNLAGFARIYELSEPDGRIVPVEQWPVSRVMRGESISSWELLGRRKDTGQKWVFIFSGEPVRNESGKQVLALTITRDVTAEKRATEALKESEDRFRTLANSIPQLAWMTDEKGWIFWYNQRWYEYTGTNPEKMQGWGWKAVHHPEHLNRVTEKFYHHLETGEAWEDTFPILSRHGEWRWFLSRAEPIRNEQGQIVRWFGTNTDITEQRKTQEELQASLRARDEFLSIASHELKTPLTSLALQTQSIQRGIRRSDPKALSPERILPLIDQTDKQVGRLVRLVDDMLDIARITSGKLSIHKERVNLGELAREVIDRLTPQFRAAGMEPPTVELIGECTGHWDRARIEQVVTNLLTNALRYGQGKPAQIRVERLGTVARLSVLDQGSGIASEHQVRIFNRFERAVSPSEISGLGLGLFITKQIVESHGGTIRVESELGQGSNFIVELPYGA